MAFERVSTKTKELHITTWMHWLFARIDNTKFFSASSPMLNNIIVALALTLPFWIVLPQLPGIVVFIVNLLMLWACLGCPITRKIYKQYLQAASRKDFEACSLHSEEFGNKDGDLSKVGKQLVLVNYRQYASVIIFYVILGLPGMVFYCVCKEIYFLRKNEQYDYEKQQGLEEAINESQDTSQETPTNATEAAPSTSSLRASKDALFILDWVPVRITSFGYLLVGHFGNGLAVWLDCLFNTELSAYELLNKVAKASEELTTSNNPYLDEPLQLVRLVKRNTVFLVVMISLMTLVGVVA